MRDGILCQKTIPLDVWFSQCVWATWMLDLSIFVWQKQPVLNQSRITRIRQNENKLQRPCITHFAKKKKNTLPCMSATLHHDQLLIPLSNQAPCIKWQPGPELLLCYTKSNTSRATEISRLLSQMRLPVFHWSHVFLILLCFRLSCWTLRCVPALKCD